MIWQRIRAGGNSQNIQAQIANFGVGYEDAKAIAIDTFKENFQRLSQGAMQEALARNDEFTFNYLKVLHDRHPAAVENIEDPGVQSAILDAQFGYATTGDEDLGELLVDLLVDRTERVKRDTRQLLLNSALDTAKKLTPEHYRAITFLFYVYHCREDILNIEPLYSCLADKLAILWSALNISSIDIRYITSTGCFHDETYVIQSLPEILRLNYPGFFTYGFDPVSNPAISRAREIKAPTPLIVDCIRGQGHVQVNAVYARDLENVLQSATEAGFDIDSDLRGFLKQALNYAPMSDDEIRKELVSRSSVFANTLDAWNKSPLTPARLTDVGITIGHANMRRLFGEEFPAKLDIWISEV